MEKGITLDHTHLMMIATSDLAYLGDAVYELKIRRMLILSGINGAGNLSGAAADFVTAPNQAKFLNCIWDELTEEEQSVAKRARNKKPHHIPRHSTRAEYIYATALEAIFGYLSLKGDEDRIDTLINLIEKISKQDAEA